MASGDQDGVHGLGLRVHGFGCVQGDRCVLGGLIRQALGV